MIGQTVSHYRIIDFLGSGLSGSVYSAEDLKRHRLVALKIITPELARDGSFVNRLQTDLERVTEIDHPGIPRVYEQGLHDGTRFIAMQLLDGQTLESRIKAGPLPMTFAVQVGSDVAEALMEAHEKGLIHRDVKPANIVITSNGVKLLGLGLTPDKEIAGSTSRDYYLSPEQALGQPLGPESDIFSLGIILYEIVTRQRPFSGEKASTIRNAIAYGAYEPATVSVPTLPQSLDKVITKSLQRDPALRYASARELLADLREAGRDLNALILARAPLTRRRRRHFGTLLPTAATILVLALVWLLWQALKDKLG